MLVLLSLFLFLPDALNSTTVDENELNINCDYQGNADGTVTAKYWCGNQCIAKNASCKCGIATLRWENSEHYCCLPPKEKCSLDASGSGNALCQNGNVLHKSEPCNGACPWDSNSSRTNYQATCKYRRLCNHEDGYFLCGDICTFGDEYSCTCGRNKLLYHQTSLFCCPSKRESCIAKGYDDYDDAIDPVCEQGQVLHKSELCNGKCFEYNESNLTEFSKDSSCHSQHRCVS